MAIDISERKVEQNEWKLWLGWMVMTGLGLLIGFLPSRLLAEIIGLGIARILSPLLAGGLIGMGQWLVLRSFITDCSDWILATGAGWGIGYAAGIFILQLLPTGYWFGLFGIGLFGLIVGLIQWPILRREIPNIVPWIIANVVGWVSGFILSQVFTNLIYNNFEVSEFIISIVILSVNGLISGALIGAVLVWIVRKPDIQAEKVV